MPTLAAEILADNPRRFYKLGDAGAPVHDSGADAVDLGANGAPVYGQPGGIPSAPTETSVFLDGVDDALTGAGTGVASDAGSGAAKPWAMMIVAKLDAAIPLNVWWLAEGSSLNATPLWGFATATSTGRLRAAIRTRDNVQRNADPPNLDYRGVWHVLHFENDPADAATGQRLYIDGVLVGSAAPLPYGVTATTFNRLAIGALWRTTLGSFTKGFYQYAAIFDHPLGQARITAHMAAFNAAGAPAASGTVSSSGGGTTSTTGTKSTSGTVTSSTGGASTLTARKAAAGTLTSGGAGTSSTAGSKQANGGVSTTGGGTSSIAGAGPAPLIGGAISSGGGGTSTTAGRKGAYAALTATTSGASNTAGIKAAHGAVSSTGAGTTAVTVLAGSRGQHFEHDAAATQADRDAAATQAEGASGRTAIIDHDARTIQ